MRSHIKKAGVAGVAAAAAVALAAGLTTPAAAAPGGPAAPAAGAAHGAQAPGSHALTRIPLVTGDTVVLDARGGPVGFERAKGREHIPVAVQRIAGHVHVVPLDAQRLIAAGRLDARLFDVTELGRPEYRAAHRAGVRLIVGYEGAAPAARAELRRAAGGPPARALGALDAEAVRAPARGAGALWQALTRQEAGTGQRTTAPGIARIWLDGLRRASLDKSTRQIGADKAWAAGYDGKGVKIAVLDTGVDAKHPDLAGKILAQKNFSTAADAADHFGHGTHVASIAAGTGAASGGKFKGVAPGAALLSGKVLDDDGFGDDSGILAGMQWAVDQGADVVNLSLGGGDQPGIDPLEAAVNKLSKKGVLFAIAAGNAGSPGSVGSPGSADAALTVGAVDDHDKLAPFSSRGPRVGDGAVKPDVTAPGVDITAAAAPGSVIEKEVGQNPPGYLTISGTSMATPHVAGAAALLKQQHPQWKGAELKGVLTASTKPGAYSPFEQGSGRIAVDRALHQKVVAEPVSVSFGRQQWPHTDDKPVTKKVTYRNLTGKAVTLALSVRSSGPDRKPAPAGFFTLGATEVTVPARGTAAVDLTADTRLGGTLDGAYSAYVVATGGGQGVRTAAAVDREVESYDVTVRHIGLDGKASGDGYTSLYALQGVAPGASFDLADPSGAATVRLPRGRYVLNTSIPNDPKDWAKGVNWLARPNLDVTKKTTLTLDARTTAPVTVTVPRRTATSSFAAPSFTVSTPEMSAGYGYFLDSYKGFRTAGSGPAVTDGSLVQQWDGHWTYGPTTEYHAAFGGKVRRLATGFSRHVEAKDLATVKATLGANLSGKESGLNVFGYLPDGAGSTAVSLVRKLPATVTLYLAAVGGVQWETDVEQYGGRDAQGFPLTEAAYYGGLKAYRPGRQYSETFNKAVFGPTLAGEGFGLYRKGNQISGFLPLLADGAGHPGWSLFTKAYTELTRNGVIVGRNDQPLTGDPFTVPAGDALYRLSATVQRPGTLSRTSTKIVAGWSFRSAKTAKQTALPVSVVRFSPQLTLSGTSPAGRTVRVPLTVQGAAAGGNTKVLAVFVSYDDGHSWKRLTVKDGAVSVKNPAKGKAVSIGAHVADKQGNTGDVTVFRAYYAG
ncbi:S8 family serine peptidase [Streptomyces sp. NPDC089919]|uniref:S8 family peptidase n=1 Tax=Streptomyces sp. NPDC089919 TaxID=3155188 RepID=UPI003425C323